MLDPVPLPISLPCLPGRECWLSGGHLVVEGASSKEGGASRDLGLHVSVCVCVHVSVCPCVCVHVSVCAWACVHTCTRVTPTAPALPPTSPGRTKGAPRAGQPPLLVRAGGQHAGGRRWPGPSRMASHWALHPAGVSPVAMGRAATWALELSCSDSPDTDSCHTH